MELWQILILAVVQGVAEFLPISSSGHLVVLAALTGVHDNVVEVNIVLHVGTLFSIFVFYWQRILRLLGEDRRVLALLAIGTLPAVVIGLTLKKLFPELLEDPLLAGAMLVVTGLLLLWASRKNAASSAESAEPEGNEQQAERSLAEENQYVSLSFWSALLIGVSQAFAILPGISRSGATISAGLKLGLAPRAAATFSFLLALPAIAGAGVLEVKDLLDRAEAGERGSSVPLLLLGAGVSFLVGLVSLWCLVKILERGRLSLFAWWCIPVGVLVVAWQLSTPAMVLSGPTMSPDTASQDLAPGERPAAVYSPL